MSNDLMRAATAALKMSEVAIQRLLENVAKRDAEIERLRLVIASAYYATSADLTVEMLEAEVTR